MVKHSTPLDTVYAANSPDELAEAYQGWADSYDRETLELGYCLPFVITAWLARYVPANSGSILDAGCGTGLSGPLLQALGYNDNCGLDFSDKMLEAAKGRGGYSAFVQAELGKILPFESEQFAAFISTGVFTAGHAPAEALFELVRVLKPDGYAIFTVRDNVFENGGFAKIIAQLCANETWRLVEHSKPFRAFTIGEPDVLVSAYVFQKTV
jgi:predicted TPR repeat methyltransferase